MLPSIYFDRKIMTKTGEIQNVRAYRMLMSEFDTLQPAITQ